MSISTKFRRRRLLVAVAALMILVAGVAAFSARSAIRSAYEQLIGNDYQGSGYGQVLFDINEGDSGEEIAQNLVEQEVVKDFRFTYKLMIDGDVLFHPGTFRLAHKMSSAAAISALTSAESAVLNSVTIREGLRLQAVYAALSKATGIPVTEFENVGGQLELFDLPKAAPSLEGYLFPATYNFGPKSTAKSILLTLRSRMNEEITRQGIAPSDVHRVLTLAGLVQKEARITSDFYKVSRTFLNRIDAGMKLQSDATVSYGVNGSTVSTSAADRANDNPYNTYKYEGLPIGPIGAPGSVAIDAALHPAKGNWLYFCTINLATGETVFSDTYAQHEVAVQKWRAWMKDHPEYE